MKILDGTLASSASNRFGQFSIQKAVHVDEENVCTYEKRTFFSWAVHCLRFQFSKAYRQDVMEERRSILHELENSWQGQTVDASQGSSENTQPANVTLLSRRLFNSKVSELLQRSETSGGTAGTQAAAVQQKFLDVLSNAVPIETSRVLRPACEIVRDAMARPCEVSPYALQLVEGGLESGYVINTPQFHGPDRNGELCKCFLTYHTFTSDKKGEAWENMFKWEPVSKGFDPSQAFPGVAAESLPENGWCLRVPSDSSIAHAAGIADAVRGMTSPDAQNFISRRIQGNEANAEEQHIEHQFQTFLRLGLGNDLLLPESV